MIKASHDFKLSWLATWISVLNCLVEAKVQQITEFTDTYASDMQCQFIDVPLFALGEAGGFSANIEYIEYDDNGC